MALLVVSRRDALMSSVVMVVSETVAFNYVVVFRVLVMGLHNSVAMLMVLETVVFNPVVRLVELGMVGLSSSVIPSPWSIISILSSEVSLLRQMGTSISTSFPGSQGKILGTRLRPYWRSF